MNRIMEPTVLTSIIGALVFAVFATFIYRYADGKWNVSSPNKNRYSEWAMKNGKIVKGVVIKISIIYGIVMLFQILSIL